ncbi:MAG: conjugal transfer protein TraF [Treponema sp.]|nr:conjugal transfer protein TraF [Treponema sp.]
MKKVVSLFAALLCLSSVLFAEEKIMAPLSYPSTASSSLGGPHVAYADGIYSLFVNPAALQWANEGMIIDLTLGVVGPIDKLLENKDAIAGIGASFGDGDSSAMSKSLTDLTKIMGGGKLPIGVDIRGPISFGYTANGFGFGLFSRVMADARIIGIDIDANAYADLMLPFGMSFNVLKLKDHEVSAGIVLKPFVRLWAAEELNALDLMGKADLSLSMPVIAGAGGDLGFMYRFKKDLAVGLTAKDLYTLGFKTGNIINMGEGSDNNSTYRIPLSLNTGIAYTFRPASFWKVPRGLRTFYVAVMADWANLQNIFTWNNREHRNPVLDLGGGVEIGLFNFLKFRAGIHEMLPAAGIGFEPAVFKFNLALYGKELGSEPGVNSTMAFDFSISLRPDTKKKNWVWSGPMIK